MVCYTCPGTSIPSAVVVFDRAKSKLAAPRYIPLPQTNGALQSLFDLRVQVLYP